MVVVITNLPPKKLVGYESKAMLLAGDDGLTTKTGIIKVLNPPSGVNIGDAVYLEGDEEQEGSTDKINDKQWQKLVADLKVKSGKASYKDKNLVTKHGAITVEQLVDDSGIH